MASTTEQLESDLAEALQMAADMEEELQEKTDRIEQLENSRLGGAGAAGQVMELEEEIKELSNECDRLREKLQEERDAGRDNVNKDKTGQGGDAAAGNDDDEADDNDGEGDEGEEGDEGAETKQELRKIVDQQRGAIDRLGTLASESVRRASRVSEGAAEAREEHRAVRVRLEEARDAALAKARAAADEAAALRKELEAARAGPEGQKALEVFALSEMCDPEASKAGAGKDLVPAAALNAARTQLAEREADLARAATELGAAQAERSALEAQLADTSRDLAALQAAEREAALLAAAEAAGGEGDGNVSGAESQASHVSRASHLSRASGKASGDDDRPASPAPTPSRGPAGSMDFNPHAVVWHDS